MNVLLVGNFLPDRQFSMLGFAGCLQRELPKLGVEPRLLAPCARLARIPSTRRARKWLAYADKYLLFPGVLRREASRAGLVHLLDHGNAMYVRHFVGRPHLVTCHDLLAVRASFGEIPNWPMGSTGRKYQSLILDGLRLARDIAAVSEATRSDVVRLTDRSLADVRLVYNGVYQPLQPHSIEEARRIVAALGIASPYLLVVGNDSPYKNRAGAQEIHRHLRRAMRSEAPALVIAGKSGHATHSAPTESESDGVRYVDSPKLPVLTALYQAAAGLLFPSWHEGFGLPILEAQLLDCPVFASNRPPMTEVGGEAARYFDPLKPEAAAEVVRAGLAESDLMREQGRPNAARFTAERMAQEYAKCYAEIAGVRPKEVLRH